MCRSCAGATEMHDVTTVWSMWIEKLRRTDGKVYGVGW